MWARVPVGRTLQQARRDGNGWSAPLRSNLIPCPLRLVLHLTSSSGSSKWPTFDPRDTRGLVRCLHASTSVAHARQGGLFHKRRQRQYRRGRGWGRRGCRELMLILIVLGQMSRGYRMQGWQAVIIERLLHASMSYGGKARRRIGNLISLSCIGGADF